MVNRGARMALLVGVVVAAIVAFVIASPGDDDDDSSTTTSKTATTSTAPSAAPKKKVAPSFTRIEVVNGKPVGGVKKLEAKQGDRVRFTVISDVADEVHVHGYDFTKDVSAGGRVRFSFPAAISGGFEIELENRQEQIAKLQVEP